ncbi:MAG: glycosyltransferase family 2 protein [Bdellovibrionota bacterium]
MSLCIVMPAYNEEGCIEPVVKNWLTVLDKVPGTMIVVNDGSRDNTGSILDKVAAVDPRLKVVHQKNAGHGAAVQNAYRQALQTGAEWIFQTDSDDQFQPVDFPKLWEKRNTSPFILGFRQQRSDAFHRKIISAVMRSLVFVLFGSYLRDANIPYRLIRADFLRGLLGILSWDVFAPNIFLSVMAKRAGANLHEIPIHHQERQTGKVSILRWKLLKVCFRSAKELVTFRLVLASRRHELSALMANG